MQKSFFFQENLASQFILALCVNGMWNTSLETLKLTCAEMMMFWILWWAELRVPQTPMLKSWFPVTQNKVVLGAKSLESCRKWGRARPSSNTADLSLVRQESRDTVERHREPAEGDHRQPQDEGLGDTTLLTAWLWIPSPRSLRRPMPTIWATGSVVLC